MRPMRHCKKPRLDGGSDEEDEKEKELNALVRKLPCYQGEGSMANEPRKSIEVEEDEKLLEEKLRQLVEERKELKDQLNNVQELKEQWNKVEEAKIKLQEDRAKVEEEKAEVGMEKDKVEMKKALMAMEKGLVEMKKTEVEVKKAEVEKEKIKMEEEKTRMGEEKVRMEKFSREQESLVECPVCLSLPREDRAVPCCPRGHFVCSPCLNNLFRQGRPRNCPTCSVPMGQGRSLLALTVVKNAQHECGHQGCDVKLNFDQIKDHEEKCVWRLILCPGKGTTCKVRVPFCTVLKHVQTCTDCRWPPKQMDEDGIFIRNTISKDTVVRQNMNSSWSTKVIQFEGRFFFVRSEKKDENYTVDVVMKGSQEDCENFIVKASLLNVETLYSESGKSVIKSLFHPRPLTDQNEATYCLSVPEKGVSKVWKFDETEERYHIRFLVKIVKLN